MNNDMSLQNSIERLPDEMLISIVSRLPVKDAGRTSVLARRWRRFWIFSSVLDFDSSNVLCKLKHERECFTDERFRFVKWVNRVMVLNPSATIEKFRILFDLDANYANHIDTWVKYAFGKRVKRLELDLERHYSHAFFERYAFPNICDPIERLRILPIGCDSLVALCLTDVNVTGEVLEFFLSKCPFLEELCVKDSDRLLSLRTSCPSIRLRRLEVINCQHFTLLEICPPNLQSFTFRGGRVSLVLKDVSSLVNLSLGAMRPTELAVNFYQISGCFLQLEILAFQISVLGVDILPDFPTLPRLKKIVLDVCAHGHESLLCFASLIHNAPLLREFVLKLTWSDSPFRAFTSPFLRPTVMQRRVDGAKGQKNESIEVLQVDGFAGKATDVELVLYVVEHAVSLKKVVIDFHQPSARQQAEVARVNEMAAATELLQGKLPQGVELIMH